MTDYPDYEGPKQKIYLAPEWSALTGDDKNFVEAEVALAAFGSNAGFTYVPTEGKTLYLTAVGFTLRANAGASADLPQIGFLTIRWNHGGGAYTVYCHIGGNGGAFVNLPKPVAIERQSGNLEFRIYNYSNHACIGTVSAYAYEI